MSRAAGARRNVEEARSLKCPRCGLLSPSATVSCDCGYDFRTGELGPPLRRRSAPGRTISSDVLTFFLTYLLVLGGVHGVLIFGMRKFDDELGPAGGFILAVFVNLVVATLSAAQYAVVAWFMRHRLAALSVRRRALAAIVVATVSAVTGPGAELVPWPNVLLYPSALAYTGLASLGLLLIATPRSSTTIVDKNYIR